MFMFLVVVILGIVFYGLPVSEQGPFVPIIPITTTTPSEPTATTTPNDDGVVPNEAVRVTNISTNDVVKSPLVVQGEARGTWFFEASFPVKLLDAAGNQLAIAPAQAQGEWMTTDFVRFEVTLNFTPPTSSTGILVLEKDNPSGLPENAAEVRIPVRFVAEVPSAEARVTGGCVISGCSSQVCGEEEIATDCMYREEYACYQKAKCEKQATGKCGWTLTPDINACLEQYQ